MDSVASAAERAQRHSSDLTTCIGIAKWWFLLRVSGTTSLPTWSDNFVGAYSVAGPLKACFSRLAVSGFRSHRDSLA